MLDMSFNSLAKFYEAPLHIKALGGTFVIDDFGRQLVRPEALLNRWIVPLESRIEYLKLHTGKTFALPFEELVIFSTNLKPSDLMDPAFLRRIPYKLEIRGQIGRSSARSSGRSARRPNLVASDEIINHIIASLLEQNDFRWPVSSLGSSSTRLTAICKFEGIPTQLRPEFVDMALDNLQRRTHLALALRRRPARADSLRAAAA